VKFIVLLLAIAIVTQPVQAGFCNLKMNHDSSHHAGQVSDSAHKCCNPKQSGQKQDCGGDMLCGSCPAGVSAIPVVYSVVPVGPQHCPNDLCSGGLAPSHSFPLLRPPIS
jgi:hypothetical protein